MYPLTAPLQISEPPFDTHMPYWHDRVMYATMPLRQQQARQLRTAVLEAVIAKLEGAAPDDVSMAEIAQSAGISLRTLYRYFPDRATLLQSAGEHLYGTLGVTVEMAEPGDIARSFREAARRLAARPGLTRALIRTGAGQVARSAMRRQRVGAIRTALQPATAGLDSDLTRRATALIVHLCSAASWVSIADESGLSDADAQAAVSWGIDALIDALRGATRRPGRRRSSRVVSEEK
jgi:AcrR family transcriptional regulator